MYTHLQLRDSTRPPVSLATLARMKEQGEKIASLTCYDASFATLEDVVAFYATRDLDPARWYPTVNGQVQLYNDLPAGLRTNVQRGAPFRRAGQPPAITPQDAADIVAFLRTLTDGFALPAGTQ